jgi:hypothetical protein
MVMTRGHWTILIGFLLFAPLVNSPAIAQVLKPDEQTVADAYIYLLGRALVIRQEHMDRKAPDFAYNAIRYNPLGSADFVNPNFDVAYLEAWFAVDDRTPVILEVPEVKGRYYTAQILDEWGEVIVNINERTFPSKPYGRFGLVKPGWNGVLPSDVSRIELHSSKAKMLARVELKGDPEGAVKLQHAFEATSLGIPVVAPPPAMPMFGNNDLIGVEIFDDAEQTLASALDVSPIAAEMQQKVRFVAAYVASSPGPRAEVDNFLRETVVPEFVQHGLAKTLTIRNGWGFGGTSGNYGSDYVKRTLANYAGIWANTPSEVIYFTLVSDAAGQPVNGSNSYVLHFPANDLPEKIVDAYWSVILVSLPDFRVVPNPQTRFNFNSSSNLTKEADGSLKIAIAPKPVPGVPETNWLPSPEGKPFSLTFRTYVPKDIVKRGEWQPPPVTAVR